MDSDSFIERANLMTLPTEVRFMIYDLLLTCSGTLVIFANYELTRNLDHEALHLLHVNRKIRSEIQEFFYKNQTFQFRSFPAVQKFIANIGPHHASIIKNLEIGSWLARQSVMTKEFIPFFKQLPSVESLTIQAPVYGYVTQWTEGAELGEKAVALLRASPKLAMGRLHLIVRRGGANIQFLPRNVNFPPPGARVNSSHQIWRASSAWNDDNGILCTQTEVDFSGYLGTVSAPWEWEGGMGKADRPIEISSEAGDDSTDDEVEFVGDNFNNGSSYSEEDL